ncbi:Hematopoietic progenitor cell antigen CD34 [Labeo rohita]|uniref:Hematopoietic progenitor cell antigen CD34 n=2 Tax=Labeo rohita TaxID=84645 RepID=A0ABQ8MLW5_LABRO|nr:Hematopoietic progenitor cell antigen CD34 [Labeo rohita]
MSKHSMIGNSQKLSGKGRDEGSVLRQGWGQRSGPLVAGRMAVICDEDLESIIRGDGDPVLPTAKVNNKEDPETSEMSHAETTEPTQPDTQTPDRTDSNLPEKNSVTSKGNVICVDKIPERYKNNVLLKLKASSTCEETKVRIQSVLEHLCGEDCKLEIYQKDDTDEIIVYGDSIEADPEGMAGKFNNDNITDKVEVEEAISYMGQRSKIVLISLLITGLLLAALLIAGYLLKINREQSKGLRLAEDSFQVDQENQGNTLLSVAPLPQQEPLDKPIINGESPESPPTNGHSATQTQVADTPM